jgi:hypothetical protein
MKKPNHRLLVLVCGLLLCSATAQAADVTARLAPSSDLSSQKKGHALPAVIWLRPVGDNWSAAPPGKYTLMQKDKMFSQHLLVVPVGSAVTFPNADPFFHNVFSLFDGKRFDLGLYEAGSARSVVFSREGVSYIFCNIHPDMNAVVISLTTPYFSIADVTGEFHLSGVPEGDYNLHVWVEGRREDSLNHLTRRVHISSATANNLGEIQAGPREQPTTHLNKFGHPYEPENKSTY